MYPLLIGLLVHVSVVDVDRMGSLLEGNREHRQSPHIFLFFQVSEYFSLFPTLPVWAIEHIKLNMSSQ